MKQYRRRLSDLSARCLIVLSFIHLQIRRILTVDLLKKIRNFEKLGLDACAHGLIRPHSNTPSHTLVIEDERFGDRETGRRDTRNRYIGLSSCF